MIWQELAACSGKELSLFFPPENIGGPKNGSGIRGDKDRVQKAKEICDDCPVQRECLQFAIAYDCTGIYGGLDTGERRSYARMAQ